MTHKMPKGEHEEAMEEAKDLLEDEVPMDIIMEITHLDEDDIKKAKNKMEGKA